MEDAPIAGKAVEKFKKNWNTRSRFTTKKSSRTSLRNTKKNTSSFKLDFCSNVSEWLIN
jgi:hypothetical protein